MQHIQASSGGAPGAQYPEVYRNLMAIGLLGAIYRASEDAAIVHEAVEMTLEDPTMYVMHRAIAVAMGGDAAYAKASLGRRIEQQPDDDNSKVALGVSMMLSGDPEWKHWLNNVLATSTDQQAREAANGVLAYLASLRTSH
nr:hypothetical protein [uncultured Roseateles sp.]